MTYGTGKKKCIIQDTDLSQRKKVTSTHSAEDGKDFVQNGLSEKTERPTFYMRVREGHFPINCSRYTANTF